MYSQYPPATCFCAPIHNGERLEKAKMLIRPWEVAHLFHFRIFYGPPPPYTPAEEIAHWLDSQFRSGRFRYIPDPPTCDRWCSPMVTWKTGEGDCDDYTIFTASMLAHQRIKTSFTIGTFEGNGHAWVEGFDSKGAFLLESTNGRLYRYRPNSYSPDARLGHDPFALQTAIRERAMQQPYHNDPFSPPPFTWGR